MEQPNIGGAEPAHGLERHPFLRILQRDGFACQLCGSRRNLQVHHVCPRSRGGDDEDTNLLTLCCHCHEEAHAVHLRLILDAR